MPEYLETVLKSRIAMLSDQLAEARLDAARMDKAEALLAAGVDIVGGGTVIVQVPLTVHSHTTLREALDAFTEASR